MHLIDLRKVPELFNFLEKTSFIPKNIQESLSYSGLPKIISRKTEEGIEIEADVPGLKKEDITIEIEKGVLIISGERKEEKKEERENYIMNEVSYGKFSRNFSLGDKIDPDSITAKLNDGILKIELKFKEKENTEVKKIEIL